MATSYAIAREAPAGLSTLVSSLRAALEADGFSETPAADQPQFVLNPIEAEQPRPFRRRSRGTYVASLDVLDCEPVDPLHHGYPLLVRALSNVALTYVAGSGVWFTTPEQGSYLVADDGDLASLAARVVERLAPLARSTLVIDNEFRTDLERELWDGDEHTRRIARVGRRLDAFGLLPAPFPLEDLLDEEDLRHIRRLYGIGGLSYGNLSERESDGRFWMSASGVDKSRLETPGRDILLVDGYDEPAHRMLLSVPPHVEPRRVSVDAIEHWMIYERHPEVGAILHVHAWLDGATATDVNFPCGTHELATSVADLLAAQPDPAHAVIGLRNHGITATGSTLEEILEGIEPRLRRRVPMS